MTPDGISDDDWLRVHEIVCDVVNASSMEDDVLCEYHRQRLFGVLDELQLVYGRIPSIVGTRADFTMDDTAAIPLLQEALAACMDDYSEQLTLDSLVSRMIDQHFPDEIIQAHLSRLETLIAAGDDESDRERLRELKTDFQRMS
jgi:hypothetical protein